MSDETSQLKIACWILVKDKENPDEEAIKHVFDRAKSILCHATMMPECNEQTGKPWSFNYR